MAAPIAALIVRVAADLAELKTNVAEVLPTLEGVSSVAKAVGVALASAFSIHQIAGAARDVMDMTGQLADLAAKSGLTAEAVQELDFVAQQSGSNFDTISDAIAKMSKALINGDAGVVKDLEALGLSAAALKDMAPDQAFEAIAAAIAQVPDPMMRSKVAMDIFGKAGADLLPVLISDIGGLRDVARESGAVISNDLVKAGDELGDQWTEMQGKLNALKAQALLPVLDLFLQLPEPLQTITAGASAMAPSLTGIGTAILAAGGPKAALALLTSGFTTILPYLGPAGIIAVAAIAVYEAWKHWDQIVAIAERVYTGIKTWLVDRFSGVVTAVKGYIDYIISLWRSMLSVVGGAVNLGASVVNGVVGGLQPRAAGGPVSAGSPYLVGELGPELFVPRSSGAIVPAGGFGGGATTVENHFNIGAFIGSDQSAARQLADMVKREILQSLGSQRKLDAS